jgi:HD superfamily phosphodiesterase
MRYWGPDAIFETTCPACGSSMEFFKDESSRTCKKCGRKVINPKIDFGCASYCQYASQCLGELPPELLSRRKDLLKDRVAVEMKRYFGHDFKRIGHASKVARYAEQLVKEEKGDMAVVLIAGYLHDIGIKEAERKYGSNEARYQEQEGPPVARDMLTRLGATPELIDEVCDIIGHHHHPRAEETVNFKILYDADLIVNLEEKHRESPLDPDKLSDIIATSFLTVSGVKLAQKFFSAER